MSKTKQVKKGNKVSDTKRIHFIVEKFDKEKILNANVKLHEDKLNLWLDYQRERCKIYYKKEILKEQAPYTENKILQEYRFTNVKRWLDRGSKDLIKHCLAKDISMENKLLNIILYRGFIPISDYMEKLPLGYIDFEKPLDDIIQELEALKINFFPRKAPYFIVKVLTLSKTKCIKNGYPAKYKIYDVFYPVIYLYNNKEVLIKNYLQDLLEVLNTYVYMLGNFYKYQIMVDLTYIKDFKHYTENDFVISGIGCDFGISLLVKDIDNLTPEEFLYWFKNYIDTNKLLDYEQMLHYLPEEHRCYTLMDLENSFCEFSKYVRLLSGNVRTQQRKYKKNNEINF